MTRSRARRIQYTDRQGHSNRSTIGPPPPPPPGSKGFYFYRVWLSDARCSRRERTGGGGRTNPRPDRSPEHVAWIFRRTIVIVISFASWRICCVRPATATKYRRMNTRIRIYIYIYICRAGTRENYTRRIRYDCCRCCAHLSFPTDQAVGIVLHGPLHDIFGPTTVVITQARNRFLLRE